MKNCITRNRSVLMLFSFVLFSSVKSQIKYDDIKDLIKICKKEDFSAVKIFLENKNLRIDKFNTNFDHGGYFALAEITTTAIGTEAVDNLDISFKEYDKYKSLEISRFISGDLSYLLPVGTEPLWHWPAENWTTVITIDGKKNQIQIGAKQDMFFIYPDTSARLSTKELSKVLVDSRLINKAGFWARVINSNPSLGDIQQDDLMFSEYFAGHQDCTFSIVITFPKGKNIDESNGKILSIPLVMKGKTYSLNLTFGNLRKTYIFDSGASDMSIDNETYQYLENSGQLKIENRLSDAEYQLADGSIVRFKRIQIPQFNINEIVIKNIESTVIENGKPLLLGKSFLDSFKSWKIDNEKQLLIVELF